MSRDGTAILLCSVVVAGGRNYHANKPGTIPVRDAQRILEVGRVGRLADLTAHRAIRELQQQRAHCAVQSTYFCRRHSHGPCQINFYFRKNPPSKI